MKKDSVNLYLGEGNGTPLQSSCLENPMDRGASWAAVHGVARSWTQLSNLTFTFHFLALEKEMVTHSSVLAWRIPGIAEPGGLPFMGLHRVRHDWSNLAAAATCIYTLLGVSRLYSKHILSKFLGKIQINVWSYCNTNIFKLCMRTYFCVYIYV